MKIGEIYEGFKLVESEYYKYLDGTYNLYIHEKTGTKLIYINNDDINRAYAIGVPTPPDNDKGIPHIIEHSVFGRTPKYKNKDMFTEMKRKLTSTFLNASTSTDHTKYQVASSNEYDFKKLAEIYTELIFNNTILENDLLLKREGIRKEIEDDKLVAKGIVFNEMMGAYSNISRETHFKSAKTLNTNCYRYDFGGKPVDINDLTYEEFCAYYKKYYNPSNFIIYFYGKLEILGYLKMLNEEYLINYTKSEEKVVIELNEERSGIIKLDREYSYEGDEGKEEKSIFIYNKIIKGLEKSVEDTYGVWIIIYVLMGTHTTEFNKSAIQRGISKSIGYGLELFGKEEVQLSISSYGSNYEKSDEFLNLIKETFNNALAKGLDKDIIISTIEGLKISLLQESTNKPRGIEIFDSIARLAIYNKDYKDFLDLNILYNKLMDKVDTDYYEKLIEKYLINDNNSLYEVFIPKKGLMEADKKAIENKNNNILNKLNEDDKKKIIDEQNIFLEWQSEEDESVIRGKEKDSISEKALYSYDLDCIENSDPGIYYKKQKLGELVHAEINFDLNHLKEDEIQNLIILTRLLGQINTEKYIDKELRIKCTRIVPSLSFSYSLLSNKRNRDEYNFQLAVTFNYLVGKEKEVFEFIGEIISNTKFDNYEDIRKIIKSHKQNAEDRIKKANPSRVIEKLEEGFAKIPAFTKSIDSVGLKNKCDKILANIKEEMIIIEDLRNSIVRNAKINIYLTGENFTDESLEIIKAFASKFSNSKEYGKYTYKGNLDMKSEAYITEDKVNYVGMALVPKYLKWSNKFRVFNKILANDYLNTKVRIENGAYSTFIIIAGERRGLILLSIEDPEIAKTIDIYKGIADYLESITITQDQIDENIVKTIGNIDNYETKVENFKTSVAFKKSFAPENYEELRRKDVLGVTVDDFKDYIAYLRDGLDNTKIVVMGNEEKILDNKKLFDEIIDYRKL
ncbi:MAG: insulinase family protein [Clostridia bacterium]|nr:insulinase family protein [Clostridia bacterium]